MNGFFLIRGEDDQLGALVNSDDWSTHTVRAFSSDAVTARMELWISHIPD
jgi:hypothetical protein